MLSVQRGRCTEPVQKLVTRSINLAVTVTVTDAVEIEAGR